MVRTVRRTGRDDFPMYHGRVSLSFGSTLAHRGSAEEYDRIPGPAALGQWLRVAALVDGSVIVEDGTYCEAILMRDAIWRIADACAHSVQPDPSDVAVLNAAAARWSSVAQLDPVALRTRALVDKDQRSAVESALGRVAFDAIELFASPPERAQLRRCALHGCTGIFLARGPGRPRCFCAPATCGNRAKVAAFRLRQRENPLYARS